MSYVRWNAKLIADCEVCHNKHWVAILPEHPEWLSFRPDPEKYPDRLADNYPRACKACSSCWYIWGDCSGTLALEHGRCAGGNPDDAQSSWRITAEEAATWEPPTSCPHGSVARESAREYAAEEATP